MAPTGRGARGEDKLILTPAPSVAASQQVATRTCVILADTRRRIAIHRRWLNPWWGLSGASDMDADRAAPTQRSGGPSGVLHIVRELRPADPYHSYNFVVSFGGYKDPVGAIVLGKALGPRDLVALLQKLGVSEGAARLAAKELLVQHRHVILGVTLTKERLRRLGL